MSRKNTREGFYELRGGGFIVIENHSATYRDGVCIFCARTGRGFVTHLLIDHSEGHDGYYFPDTDDFFCTECEEWMEGDS